MKMLSEPFTEIVVTLSTKEVCILMSGLRLWEAELKRNSDDPSSGPGLISMIKNEEVLRIKLYSEFTEAYKFFEDQHKQKHDNFLREEYIQDLEALVKKLKKEKK